MPRVSSEVHRTMSGFGVDNVVIGPGFADVDVL